MIHVWNMIRAQKLNFDEKLLFIIIVKKKKEESQVFKELSDINIEITNHLFLTGPNLLPYSCYQCPAVLVYSLTRSICKLSAVW